MELLFLKANPDIETLKVMLSIAAVMIGGLVTAVTWLIVRYYSEQQSEARRIYTEQQKKIEKIQYEQSEQLEKMNAVISTLLEAVNNLKTVVEVIKEQQAERDPRTELRLNEHSKKIDVLDSRLIKIETMVDSHLKTHNQY